MTTTTAPEELMFLGSRVRILTDGEATDGRMALLDMIDVPPGHMPPLHVHRTHDEGFLLLDGELTLFLPDGERVELAQGDFFLAPRGVPHTYKVGVAPARWLVTSSPAGFERFVADVAALPAPDPDRLTAVAAEHDIEILGPPGIFP
jgi:quercetin dioxygenase-like cupin family protein